MAAKTIEDIERIISEYDALIERAIDAARVPPSSTYVGEPEYARLQLDDRSTGVASLIWPEVDSGYYNSASIECQHRDVLISALLLSDQEYDAWKTVRVSEERSRREHQDQLQRQALADQEEIRDRREFVRLKQKYERGGR